MKASIRGEMVVVALCLLLTGCAAGGKAAGAREQGPVIHIQPLRDVYSQATVGVLPFQVPFGVHAEQGLRISALFKDVLLGKRVFPAVRQLTEPYGDLEEALRLGRAAGVELVMAGRVDHLLAGTEVGGSRISVSVRLLDTASGHTVWYVAQSALQEADYPDVSFGSRLRSSFSTPPVRPAGNQPSTASMLTRLAHDLAEVLQGR